MNDDLLDAYDQPEAPPPPEVQPPAVQPPGVPEDFTTAEGLRLQQLQQGWSQINQDHDSGAIDTDTFRRMADQIQPQRQKLLGQKQASEQFQKQQAIRDAHEQAAVQQSIQLQNRQIDADSLPQAIRTATNPSTGRTVLLAPKGYDVIDDGEGGEQPAAGPSGIDYVPQPGVADAIGTTPEKLEQTPEGHKLTIWNGLHRQEVQYDANGMRTGIQNFAPDGSPVVPQAPAADQLWKQAASMVGFAEPPRTMAGPHGRPVPNPAWNSWATSVREVHNRLQQQNSAHEKAVAQQAETDYRDGLHNHPLKDYRDAADPHAAREDAMMGDFAKLHPNDPRVQQWQTRTADREAALAKKDPATMSLPDLAAAVIGPHANVQSMIEKSAKEVQQDENIIPADTSRGGSVYNPSDGKQNGVYKNMDPEGIHEEAVKRVKARLGAMLRDQRQSAAPPGAARPGPNPTVQNGTVGNPPPTAPGAAAPQPGAKGTVPAAQLPPSVRAQYQKITGAPGEHRKIAGEAKPPYDEKGRQVAPDPDPSFGAF